MTKECIKGYLLGVDTGSSKTHALVTDLSGQALGFGEAGCGNYEVVGVEGLSQTLEKCTKEALLSASISKDEIAAMGFGLSGYDWPSEESAMRTAIDSLKIPAQYDFVNDVVIGLIAGAEEGWGIAVDAGTGNNVRGRDLNGNTGRITGNSITFGEFGGAGELVWRAVVEVTYAWTQRGPKTRMTQMFMDFAEVDSENELIEALAMRHIHPAPSLAKEIFKLAAGGDDVAQRVIEWTAHELGLNVNAVIRQLNFQDRDFDVVLIGSLFKAGDAYIEPFARTVQAFAPGANLIQLNVPPVVGSILLAAEALEIPTREMREKLVNSTENLLAESLATPGVAK